VPPAAQVNEYKYEIERLMREMNDLKRRYFESKRRDQIAAERSVKSIMPAPQASTQPRFTGGGFSLSTQP
jgi:hypothetical protein